MRYQGASDGCAEVRTAQGGSSLAAGAIWDQVVSWCGEHDVAQARWSVVRGSEPRAFAELIRALGGLFAGSTEVLVADIDAAIPIGARMAFGVLARDPAGLAVSVGECTLSDGVARLSGAYTLRAHRCRGAYTAVLRQRLATASEAGATVALARGLAATSAPILARSGFTRYATWDKYTIPLTHAGGRDLD